MTQLNLRRFALAAIAMPLALGLAACGKEDGDTGGLSGEPIAKVAAPAGKTWGDVVAKTPEGGYRMSNPEAPIKLIEYGSLTCSHCADFAHKAAAPLRDTFVASGRVSFEFRNFVRDPMDIAASLLARCGAPESFFALTDQLFANQPAMFKRLETIAEPTYQAAMNQPDDKRFVAVGELAGLTEFVASRGVARDQANACLANVAEAKAIVERARQQGEELEIAGTPTFIINGAKFNGNTWEEVKARLEALGAR